VILAIAGAAGFWAKARAASSAKESGRGVSSPDSDAAIPKVEVIRHRKGGLDPGLSPKTDRRDGPLAQLGASTLSVVVIQFHKKNLWIDPVGENQYFVGVRYFEEDIDSVETLLDIPITSPAPAPADPIEEHRHPTEKHRITHNNLQTTIDLTMGVYERPRARRRRCHASRRGSSRT